MWDDLLILVIILVAIVVFFAFILVGGLIEYYSGRRESRLARLLIRIGELFGKIVKKLVWWD